jgi:hypothetical protein
MDTVGEFKSDGKAVWGPQRYMEEQGFRKLEGIMAGTDAAFEVMVQAAPPGTEPVRLVLVALQTDYAGWKGTQQLLDGLKR